MIFAWLWLQQLTCLSKGYHTIIADLGFEEFQMERPKLNFSGFYIYVKFIQFTWNRLKNVEQLLLQQYKHSQLLPTVPSCIDYPIFFFLLWNWPNWPLWHNFGLMSKMSNFHGSPTAVVKARGKEGCVFPLIEVVCLLFAYFFSCFCFVVIRCWGWWGRYQGWRCRH